MAGTFSQIYIQVVFAVSGREALIDPSCEERLYQYITGIIQKKEQKVLAINGMPDHLHFFIGMKSSCRLSDLVREIKKSSNEFINDNKLSKFNFNWQEGYGAFSYSHSQIDDVIKYIQNQKKHHQRKPFHEEYIDLLNKFQIDHDTKYLFQRID
jgi:putative transposase